MFDLIFEHSDFLVIHKHSGVSVHKDAHVLSFVSEIAKQTNDPQLYLIHRLDKMTSGLLLLGRNAKAASELSVLFANRSVTKFYLALLSKKPKKKQGTICGDMEKSRRGMWKLLPSKNNPAITQFFSQATDDGKRVVICKPYTGKTHQIRVAMKSIGTAIVGDERYGGGKADRGYLHAFGLCFHYQGTFYEFFLPPQIGASWPKAFPHAWLNPSNLLWPEIKNSIKNQRNDVSPQR